MSLEYLARLEKARFPLVVKQATDIDSVCLLKAAEMITASVAREPRPAAVGEDSHAVVFGITERGELALRGAMMPPEAPLRRGRQLDSDLD